jgi:hypothetical protein
VSEIDPKYLSWFKHEDNRRFVAEQLGFEPWITVCQFIEGTESEGGGSQLSFRTSWFRMR